MPFLNPVEAAPALPSTMHRSPAKAGLQRQGKWWSNLKEICELLHITAQVSVNNDEVLFQHMRFKSGQRVYAIGEKFRHLYVVNSGFLKTVLIDDLGGERVLSFPMKGDMLGVDGISTSHHSTEAVALSECDIILLPFRMLAALGQVHPGLENLIYGVLSRELVRENAMAGILCGLCAEARIARFLFTLAERFAAMGYSSKLFNLPMTRQEIGNHLGMNIETVSRTLSVFNEVGLITVDKRTIGIKDAEALHTLRRLSPRARAIAGSAAKLLERPKLSSSAMPAVIE